MADFFSNLGATLNAFTLLFQGLDEDTSQGIMAQLKRNCVKFVREINSLSPIKGNDHSPLSDFLSRLHGAINQKFDRREIPAKLKAVGSV